MLLLNTSNHCIPQPVTKPEIEQVRGVNSIDVVNALIEKDC